MKFITSLEQIVLDFKFEAGTSRGTLNQKQSWFILISDRENPQHIGIGECGPLPGLSPEYGQDIEKLLLQYGTGIDDLTLESINEHISKIPSQFPAIKFAIETALFDLRAGGKRVLFPSAFTEHNAPININGLVWMGDQEFMLSQIVKLVEKGFKSIKMKIGAKDFDTERKFIEQFRRKYPSSEYELRLDANGAFEADVALERLYALSQFDIHSIEQPIRQGQLNEMAHICAESPIPIALDEELIGKSSIEEKQYLIEKVKPEYLILKPTLLGGLNSTKEWVEIAERNNIKWWLTSMLESNIGLNAIAQFVATLKPSLPQGLGTGQLYHNNIPSPLYLEGPYMKYGSHNAWELPFKL